MFMYRWLVSFNGFVFYIDAAPTPKWWFVQDVFGIFIPESWER